MMKTEQKAQRTEPKAEPKKKDEGICRGCAQAFCVNPYAVIYYCDALKTTKRGEESCKLFERRGEAE